MTTRMYNKENLIAFIIAVAFVFLAVGVSKWQTDSKLGQKAGIFHDGIVNSPPTEAYCSPKKDTLADHYESFLQLARKDISGYTANIEWNSKLSVDRGNLLLRNFTYSLFSSNGVTRYTYSALGKTSHFPADCYCKKAVEENKLPYFSTWIYGEDPFIRRPNGYKGPAKNIACCSGKDSKDVTRGEVYDKTDPTNMCCPSGKVVKRCTDTEPCLAASSTISSTVTFETVRNSDGCCVANRLSKKAVDFLKNLGGHCSPKVTATASGCHSFGSDHYGGCAIDIDDTITKECLTKAGYRVDSSYSEGSCKLEIEEDGGKHYHCILCNSGGNGTPGYDGDGNY